MTHSGSEDRVTITMSQTLSTEDTSSWRHPAWPRGSRATRSGVAHMSVMIVVIADDDDDDVSDDDDDVSDDDDDDDVIDDVNDDDDDDVSDDSC